MHNTVFKAATGPYLMVGADDVAFKTNGWYSTLLKPFEQYEDKILLVYANDGFQGEKLATHGLFHKHWFELLGYIYPPQYHVAFLDNWVTDVAQSLNRRIYFPEICIEHLHPAVGKGAWDDVYGSKTENGGNGNEQRMYYSNGESQRRLNDIGKLKQYINLFSTP
jgi:hypothetical protein